MNIEQLKVFKKQVKLIPREFGYRIKSKSTSCCQVGNGRGNAESGQVAGTGEGSAMRHCV